MQASTCRRSWGGFSEGEVSLPNKHIWLQRFVDWKDEGVSADGRQIVGQTTAR
jgi:hypothetical protein